MRLYVSATAICSNHRVTDLSYEREGGREGGIERERDPVILPRERLTEQECKHGN